MQQSDVRKLRGLIFGLSLYISDAFNCSQVGPFFPTEASLHKKVSTTFIGVITGSSDLVNFITTLIFGSFVSSKNSKFFYCTGAMLSACCSGLFGVMGYSVGGAPFIILCTVIRATMGIGAAMMYATGVTLLVPIYPEWSGRVTSLIETSFGTGMLIGPLVGSSLFNIGGYELPFICGAFVQILLVILCVFVVPNKIYDDENYNVENSEHIEESQTIRNSADEDLGNCFFCPPPTFSSWPVYVQCKHDTVME